jgi:hypothetical protein
MCASSGLASSNKMSAQKRVLVAIFESYCGSLSSGMTSSKFLKIMKVRHDTARELTHHQRRTPTFSIKI